jgi:hypothetical protein
MRCKQKIQEAGKAAAKEPSESRPETTDKDAGKAAAKEPSESGPETTDKDAGKAAAKEPSESGPETKDAGKAAAKEPSEFNCGMQDFIERNCADPRKEPSEFKCAFCKALNKTPLCGGCGWDMTPNSMKRKAEMARLEQDINDIVKEFPQTSDSAKFIMACAKKMAKEVDEGH